MRISSDRNSPNYKPSLIGCTTVFLDDVVVPRVLFVDEEEGIVEVAVLDKRGNIQVAGDAIVTAVRHGRVRLVSDNWQHVNGIGFDRWQQVRLEGIHHRYQARIDALPRACPGDRVQTSAHVKAVETPYARLSPTSV
jgi:hypothetical protein